MSPLLLGLALGSALGGAVGAFILRRASVSSPTPAAVVATPAPIPAWSWRDGAPPPRFDVSARAAALDAWRSLRGPDGGPADFATRAASLRALLLRLPPASFPSLLDQLSADQNLRDSDAFCEIAFRAWAELDPAAASRWAVSRPGSKELLYIALQSWGAADPRAAAAWACALPDEKLAQDLAGLVLPALAKTDASAAMSIISARGEDFRRRLLPAVLPVLARRDPVATMQTYGPLLWDGGNGLDQLREALATWVERDPAAAIAWVLAQPSYTDWDPINLAYLNIKAANRAAFAQALLDAPGFVRSHRTVGSLLYNWSRDDAKAALAWVATIPDVNLRAALLEYAVESPFARSPDQQLPLALALPEGENRRSRIAGIFEKWAQNSPTDALRWIEAHSTEPGVAAASYAAHAAVLGVIARDEPATAIAQWQALPEGRAKTEGLRAIVATWGQSDPGAALQWQVAQAQPDGPSYPSPDLVFQWAQKDATAALNWAETLPPEPRRYALASLTSGDGNLFTPPAVAADLYAQIQDPALRIEFLTAHLTGWRAKDPAAAKAWLEKSDALSPEQAAVLLTPTETAGKPR